MPLDFEVMDRYRLEEPTAVESEWSAKLTPAEYAIYRVKLELICEEAKQVLVQMGVSDAIQAGDCIVGIYTARGDLAVSAVGTYLHAATGQIPIKYAIKHYGSDPTVGVRDGDNFFANEALYGGIHNPDQLNVIPIMIDGEIVAWAAAASHEPETGAIDPGGMPPGATSRWDEGLKVPPIKIGENFRLKTDVMNTIVNNVRDERMIANDMRARSAACLKIRQRLLDLMGEKGPEFLIGLLRRLVDDAAEGARRRIAQLNDGIFRHNIFFDTRGYKEGLGRIAIKLVKHGDRITIDLTGTSPQTQSFLNTRPHIVRAVLIGDLCQYLFSDLPASSGVLEPFDIIAPEGTCVNPSVDAAISGSVRMTPMVCQGIHMCINKLMFDSPFRDRVAVPLGTASRNMAHGGRNQFNQIVTGLIPACMNGAGGGARPTMDGVDGAGFYFSGWGDTLDVEHEELRTPFLYAFRNIPRDQGGFGKYRGGAGVSNCLVVHGATGAYNIISLVVTAKFPIDQGLFGGYAAGLSPVVELKEGQWEAMFHEGDPNLPTTYHALAEKQAVRGSYQLNSMVRRSPFVNGESVAIIASSAGGYGDALERDLDLVQEDLRRGLLSVGAAEKVYHVACAPDTGIIDRAASEARRDEERIARRRRGMLYGDFLRGWAGRRPRPEIIQWFGPWPEADDRAKASN